MRKIVIIGAGHVGSHCGEALAAAGVCDEIVLVDLDKDKAHAQALDISDSVAFLPREVAVRDGDYSEVESADITVVAIGEPRKPGQTRLDLLGSSVVMMKRLLQQLKPYTIKGVVVTITNPADIVADYMRKGLGLPRTRVFGTGTLLDTARLIRTLARESGVSQRSIEAYSLGEHGDSSMIPFSAIRIGGQSFEAAGVSKEAVLEETRQRGMTIIEGKKSTEFGIGRALAEMAACILRDEKRVLPASVLLEGEYGETDVHCGVPCRIGRDGIEKIIELPLDEEEKAMLHASCEIIRKHIRMAAEQ